MEITISDKLYTFNKIEPKNAHTGEYFIDTTKTYFLKKLFPEYQSLLQHEVSMLTRLAKYNCFPKLVQVGDTYIITTYCGEPATKKNQPQNYEAQCNNIQNILLQEHVVGEFKKEHLLVKDGTIYLIDFGGARIQRPVIQQRIASITLPNYSHPAHRMVSLSNRMKLAFS